VVVAGSTRKQDILMSLHAGVHGYVPKNASPDELTTALKMVLGGMIYVPPSVASTPSVVLEESRTDRLTVSDGSLDDLTPRQREVLELLVQGKSNKEIARDLKLGEGTVKIHMAGLFRALGVTTRAAAAAAGIQLLYR
jgi:DNA-binding NarL/FixJ family response regulator